MTINEQHETERSWSWGELAEQQADRLVESGRYANLMRIICDETVSEDFAPGYVIVEKDNGVRHGNPIVIPADEADGPLGEAYEKAVRNLKIVNTYLGVVCNDDA